MCGSVSRHATLRPFLTLLTRLEMTKVVMQLAQRAITVLAVVSIWSVPPAVAPLKEGQ